MHKYIFVLLALLLRYFPLVAQSDIAMVETDIQQLIGAWEGELTYLDYQTSKPYTMPANLRITRVGLSDQYRFENLYPGEPQANSIDTFTIKGSNFWTGPITARKESGKDLVELTTSSAGTDGNDNQSANFRHTYIIGKTIFQIKKEVLFVGTSKWIVRHTYRYNRSLSKF